MDDPSDLSRPVSPAESIASSDAFSQCDGERSTTSSRGGSSSTCLETLLSREASFCLIARASPSESEIEDILKTFELPLVQVDSAKAVLERSDVSICIINEFDASNSTFATLAAACPDRKTDTIPPHCEVRVVSPLGLRELLSLYDGKQALQELLLLKRPMYNLRLRKMKFCFASFWNKNFLTHCYTRVHRMSGSVVRRPDRFTTHLIANMALGPKYEYCSLFGIPLLKPGYIEHLWENRDNPQVKPDDPELLKEFRAPAFYHLHVAFFGFSTEEKQELNECLKRCGGIPAEPCFDHLRFLVVKNSAASEGLPEGMVKTAHVVTEQWFWESMKDDVALPPAEYLFKPRVHPARRAPPEAPAMVLSPRRRSRDRRSSLKRKRDKEEALPPAEPQTTQQESIRMTRKMSKSRSTVTTSSEGETLNSTVKSGDFDFSRDSLGMTIDGSPADDVFLESPSPRKEPKLTSRHQVFLELLQTEKNYVNVLDMILKARVEWEDLDPNHAIMEKRILDMMFGNIQPIRNLHAHLQADFEALAAQWNEKALIGDKILQKCHSGVLVSIYKKYVKDFEEQKRLIHNISASNSRFYGFLRSMQGKQEYGRQSLEDLLIRPVQRLPSVMLLLKDLRKHTPVTFEDHASLGKAMEALDLSLHDINEERRLFDQKVELIHKFNRIENCPADLISYLTRSYVGEYNVIDLNNATGKKGDPMTLFIFTDVILVCKRRSSKTPGSLFRSPSTMSLSGVGGTLEKEKLPPGSSGVGGSKPYKFISCLEIRYIRQLIDIHHSSPTDSNESISGAMVDDAFALKIRRDGELRETLYVFQLMEDRWDAKDELLKIIKARLAAELCLPNPSCITITTDWEHLGLGNEASNTSIMTEFRRLSRAARKFSFKSPMKRVQSSILHSPSIGEGTLARGTRLMSSPDKFKMHKYGMSTASLMVGRSNSTPSSSLTLRKMTSSLSKYTFGFARKGEKH